MVEQRKSRRFELKFPVEVTRTGGLGIPQTGETLNLSSSGVLFRLAEKISIGDSIEYIITLPRDGADGPGVRLRCLGKVVRHEPAAAAATLERYEFIRD